MADVLVITSSVRVLNRIHSGTANLRPRVPLHTELVVIPSSLEHWLVWTAATRDKAYDGTARGWNGLTRAAWQPNASLLAIIGVAHDHARRTGGTRYASAIGRLLFAHGYHGTLWHLRQRHDVADGKLSLSSTVDKLTSVSSLDGNHEFLLELVTIWIMENDLGNRGATSWVVSDAPDEALDVSVSLDVVNRAELDSSEPALGLRSEDKGLTLTLAADATTHGFLYYLLLEAICSRLAALC